MLDNKAPWRTFSLTKYRSSSTCLVLACWIGVAERRIVLRLSPQATEGFGKMKFNSVSKEEIQVISATKWAGLLNSAFILDLDIVCCFLDCQEIKFWPKYTQKPEVDLRSSRSDAQSASQKPSRAVGELQLVVAAVLSQLPLLNILRFVSLLATGSPKVPPKLSSCLQTMCISWQRRCLNWLSRWREESRPWCRWIDSRKFRRIQCRMRLREEICR